MHNYNTQQEEIILREYGRNIQKLVQYIASIEDRQQRTNYAYALVALMKQLTPETKNNVEYQSKYWDDLYIMSHFELDIDSPYPMPEKSALGRKPQKVPYSTNEITYKHYGKNIEKLIEKALEIEDQEQCFYEFLYISQLMRTFYANWNKDNIDDETLMQHLITLSKGKISQEILDRLFSQEENKKISLQLSRDRHKNQQNNKNNNRKKRKKK
ncbi:MAG: DUF4290 domain-containing protein [Microscillaceae bacterium]|nr:DUF4290 domain-containing protein [Microscillaceae bacterium]MDW8460332.1 DUF4290 domain-containing protein [Cytophagales bacterium]